MSSTEFVILQKYIVSDLVPAECGFYRWRRSGIWHQILESLQQQADAQGKLNWEVHHVDGSVISAHQHSAGAKRGHLLQPANSLR